MLVEFRENLNFRRSAAWAGTSAKTGLFWRFSSKLRYDCCSPDRRHDPISSSCLAYLTGIYSTIFRKQYLLNQMNQMNQMSSMQLRDDSRGDSCNRALPRRKFCQCSNLAVSCN